MATRRLVSPDQLVVLHTVDLRHGSRALCANAFSARPPTWGSTLDCWACAGSRLDDRRGYCRSFSLRTRRASGGAGHDHGGELGYRAGGADDEQRRGDGLFGGQAGDVDQQGYGKDRASAAEQAEVDTDGRGEGNDATTAVTT